MPVYLQLDRPSRTRMWGRPLPEARSGGGCGPPTPGPPRRTAPSVRPPPPAATPTHPPPARGIRSQ